MLAERVAFGWFGPRPECVAHRHARASPPTGSRFRLVALSPRLLSVFPVFSPTDTFRQYAPWPTRPPRAPDGLRNLSPSPSGLDFGRSAAARCRCQLDPHHSPWPAGAALDATAR